MKRRIHIELLVTSGLAILLTLTFAMFVFYGLFRSQIIRDLETDARVMKNMGVFDDISRMAEKNGSISSEDLRITVVSPGGDVLFDSSADAAVMENHEDRPEIRTALEAGEGSGSRRSETMDKNLFYYAVRMENGNVLRISREADSFFAVFQNMLPTVLEVSLVLFVLSIFLSNYFTKTLVGPIEEMARNISDPGQEVVYRELEPFVATIRAAARRHHKKRPDAPGVHSQRVPRAEDAADCHFRVRGADRARHGGCGEFQALRRRDP